MIHNAYYESSDLKKLHAENIKVICCGVTRSGSVIAYQMLTDLYSEGVVKVHDYYYSKHTIKVLATVRDFRDCVVSMHHFYERPISVVPLVKVEEYAKTLLSEIESLQRYQQNHDCRVVRYEEFAETPDILFEAIEDLMDVMLPPTEKNKMTKSHSLEANRKIADVMSSHLQCEQASMIHGNHIYDGKSRWREYIEDHEYINTLLKKPLEEFGYL